MSGAIRPARTEARGDEDGKQEQSAGEEARIQERTSIASEKASTDQDRGQEAGPSREIETKIRKVH